MLALALVFAGGSAASHSAEQKLDIVTKGGGTHSFTVELATNDAERSKGLMFREKLPEGHGMLFDFQEEQDVSFWMKNTLIPLDMIFIRADGTIRRIAANTEPLSERAVPSGGPVRYVLEVSGGTARKLGIEPGDKVAAPILR